MDISLFFIAVVLGSALMTWVLRQYALRRNIIDIPNARSSHVIPTPRGGGVAIVVIYLLAIVLLYVDGAIDQAAAVSILGAGALVAVIGFMDDHGHIAARWRLLGHFSAALWALFWVGGLPSIEVFGWTINLSWAGYVLGAFYLVWMLNLYNFMDGIDGLASIEAICACLGAALIYWLAGSAGYLLVAPLLLAAAVAGFLLWNFPPARIFMGDAGSGFLGLILGVLSLQAAWAQSQLLWVWLILLGVFIVDATFTLFRRLLRGEKVYEAHRTHGYQYASRSAGRHLPVTLAVTAINIVWLFPIALGVGVYGWNGALCLVLAYVPLIALAYKFKAGTAEPVA